MKNNEKKRLILLLLSTLCIVLALVSLYALSPLSNREIYRGSFSRDFIAEKTLTPQNVLDLGVNSYYISGLTEDEVFLSNYTNPIHLVRMNRQLKDTQHIRLHLEELDSVVSPKIFKTEVDPPYFYMTHGVHPALMKGKVGEWRARHHLSGLAFYTDAVSIDSSTFAIRYFSKSQQAYALALLQEKEPQFKPNTNILRGQAEGMFSVSGMLHYSKELQKVVYLYSYRNQFMVMDKELNLLHRHNTLDTISIARVKVDKIESDNSYTLTSQPAVTQKMSAVSGNYLFVQSALLAKNEDKEEFKKKVVIDLYDINTGDYQHSFYLPRYKNNSIKNFKVTENRLLAIHDQYLVAYRLPDIPSPDPTIVKAK
ncbi:hypothetical protein ED312_09790 [Sinomicrobium pectinilyticum]|uniref:Uncharacterized protein n=1 Tax=Sinomicrobium pectinilyticum TaxID=1084421 RepID=A0A3N0EIS2_SINP1|nr:hypothetical protein [Sinomicrobium pectinilyticum]RNL87795.1 hypothetical protein ED312_09790 [Sinomicrobium pectinilyticum]